MIGVFDVFHGAVLIYRLEGLRGGGITWFSGAREEVLVVASKYKGEGDYRKLTVNEGSPMGRSDKFYFDTIKILRLPLKEKD